MGFKWTTNLDMDEMWLNSDREILGRVTTAPSKAGIRVTLALPKGDPLQVDIEQWNAEGATTFCNIARDYYNEWKAGKEASQKRRHRDLEQQRLVDSKGGVLNPERSEDDFPVEEAVSALQGDVSGATSLEEEVVRRLDGAIAARGKLQRYRDELEQDLKRVEKEIDQLTKMNEVFNASRVLEQASNNVSESVEEGQGEGPGVDSDTHSPEAESERSEGAE